MLRRSTAGFLLLVVLVTLVPLLRADQDGAEFNRADPDEAAFIRQKAQEAGALADALSQRANLVAALQLITILLAALGSICTNVDRKWAKSCSTMAGVFVVAIASVNSQYFRADKDSAESIRSELRECLDKIDLS